MPSDNRVTTFLSDEDKELFDRAMKLYGLGQSELAKEVLHSWLFTNKLNLIGGSKKWIQNS